MTHLELQDKTGKLNIPHSRLKDFLNALYGVADPELYLEIRAIHPQTKDAKVYWSAVGQGNRLADVLKEVKDKNLNGYSLYFAPCLWKTRQGKAEAAAVVTALWVDLDCDDDPVKLAAAMEKLKAFDPQPSIIIDSGGGYHPYWLLDQPFSLGEESDWKQFVSILKGMFKALGGDDEYVKSVASIMRLPGSVNTKRGGVITSILEFDTGNAAKAVSKELRRQCARLPQQVERCGGETGEYRTNDLQLGCAGECFPSGASIPHREGC